MNDPLTAKRKRDAVSRAEDNGLIADSMTVRIALLDRVKSGELSLSEAQEELKRIKRSAARAGKTTRSRVYQEN